MVGRVTAFLDLFCAGTPGLLRAFAPIRRALGSPRAERLLATIHRTGRRPRWLERLPLQAAG